MKLLFYLSTVVFARFIDFLPKSTLKELMDGKDKSSNLIEKNLNPFQDNTRNQKLTSKTDDDNHTFLKSNSLPRNDENDLNKSSLVTSWHDSLSSKRSKNTGGFFNSDLKSSSLIGAGMALFPLTPVQAAANSMAQSAGML